MHKEIYEESTKLRTKLFISLYEKDSQQMSNIVMECFKLAFSDTKASVTEKKNSFRILFKYLALVEIDLTKYLLTECCEFLTNACEEIPSSILSTVAYLIRTEMLHLSENNVFDRNDIPLIRKFYDAQFLVNANTGSLVKTYQMRRLMTAVTASLLKSDSIWNHLVAYFVQNTYLFGWGGILSSKILKDTNSILNN